MAPPRPGSDKDLLLTHIQRWKQWRKRIRGVLKTIEEMTAEHGGVPREVREELRMLRQRREQTVGEIRYLVNKVPDFHKVAQNHGFRMDLLPAAGGGGKGGAGGGGAAGGGGGGGSAGGGGGGAGAGGGGGGGAGGRGGGGGNPPDRDLLPGKQGRDWRVIRYNGKSYALYTGKSKAGRFHDIWRFSKESLEANGIKPGDGQRVTKAQFKRMDFWGATDEIVRANGGNTHPFKKMMRDLNEQYGGLSLLRNKEVMSVYRMAHLEGLSAGEIKARIQRTNWYQKRTEWQRQWELDFTKQTRRKMIGQRSQNIADQLEEIYGQINWRKFVNRKDINTWAEKVASGVWGEPGEAFNGLIGRLTKKAEKVEGSSAWIAKQQGIIEERNFMNRPEEAFAQLRQDAIEWLGYGGMYDEGLLKQWANDIAFSRKSQADWEQQLRRTKQALHPYLDTDETFDEAQSTYKGIAEQILGTPLSKTDSLLRDFMARDDTGAPVGTNVRMTAHDFGRLVRDDERFQFSKPGQDAAAGLTSLLLNKFQGVQ